MKKINKNDIKTYSIVLLLFIIVALIIFGIVFAFKNYNRDDMVTLKDFKARYTLANDQLDSVTQPTPNVKITSSELPKANNTLEDISLKELKQLFQTDKKSILVLVKDGCAYCSDIEPKLTEALNSLNLKAYRINVSKLSSNELEESYKYIEYEGTPTIFIINNGKAIHTLTGTTDIETLKAFFDYFYTRNN